MEAANGNKWLEVWTRKGREAEAGGLASLMRADGFDAGTGSMTEDDWLRQAERIAVRLDLARAKNVLEVGCGAGAMLWPLRDLPLACYGVDYSETLVDVACRAMPDITVQTAEAAALPFPDATFEAVFSHGVFFYFPDLDYAARALEEITRVLIPGKGRALILDLPDMALRDACERFRREVAYGGKDYPTEQEGPYRHTYYPRSFFTNFAAGRGMRAEFFDQDIASYPMSPYRYNVLLRFDHCRVSGCTEGASHAAGD